ncbi:ABC transporter permease [Cohnella sp. LGH]|uniref:ABC transporter permease n=1 Tax=Cohnella sp. LGH TaxID=1619153 RepID=UPI001ADC74A5|nr:ABC transporter permease [Cohnella sp. LGH]QTH42336.1 ABC transporter permease [Cohnella sp. LGH]
MIKIVQKRHLIWTFAKQDFSSKYFGSLLGIVWAFIQPTITILVYWFVFQIGFRSVPVGQIPYILWLVAGIIPWFYFQETLMYATNSISDNRFLVKKVVFDVELLPVVRMLSSLFVHLFFIAVLFILYVSYGYTLQIYNLQLIYYLAAMIFLLYGLALLASSVVIFVKDISPFIGMLLQLGFWLTPIFWSISLIPEKYANILQYNPMYYIVEGYRNSLFGEVWFWQNKPYLTIIFWSVALCAVLLGRFVFRRLRPHFSDVL